MPTAAFGDRSGVTRLSSDAGYALTPSDNLDGLAGLRSRQPISRRQFLSDVARLAERLPPHRYAVNLCTDRYRFMVGFAAALRREQITLLPANDMARTLAALASDYPDLYALADTTQPPLPVFPFPDALGPPPATIDVPILAAEQPAVILFTSGTTGQPKRIPKTWGVLVRSARSAGRRLGIADFRGGTIVGTVPHQHSYGLESAILLALEHGLAVMAERPFYPADIQTAIEAAPRPRILVTTPVHLRALVAEPQAKPAVDLILSATAPLSAELAATAEECFRAPLIEIYGSTETGQIATRRTAREAEWRCLDDVLLQQQDDGRGLVAGAAVPSPTLLEDVIEPTAPDSFILAGRSADLVDVAGKHTTLSYLNHQLMSVDGVRDGIFAMPETGARHVGRLTAFVVAPGLRAETILAALRERIDPAFLPRPLILVEALPRNNLGKLPREALLQLMRRSRIV